MAFERIYQSVRTVAVGGLVETMTDETSEGVFDTIDERIDASRRPIYARLGGQPLPEFLRAADRLGVRVDLYRDYLLPRRWAARA